MITYKRLFIFLLTLVFLVVVSGRSQFVQQGSKLVGSGAVGSAQQGYSVSLSADGNTAIVGGVFDNGNTGAAWMYTRSNGVWSQQGSKLVGTGAVGSPVYQGWSVSISADGNTTIVGGPGDNGVGAAWVFIRSGGVWTQQGSKLVGTGSVGYAEEGSSVFLSADGNTAIIGGLHDNSNAGAAWVFTRSGGVWTQQGSKLIGTGAVGSAGQGSSVSLSADGSTAIVGGSGDNSAIGATWVFTRSGGVWTQQGSKLIGSGAVGSYISQGTSVSLSGDGNTAIEGGPGDNGVGAIWVFTRSGGVWTQQGSKLVGTGAVGSAEQGHSVTLSPDGNTAIVGGPADSSGSGAVWEFNRSGGVWSQQGSKLVGTGAAGNAQQGISVSLSADGNTVSVGGWYDNSSTGAAWMYYLPGLPVITAIDDIPDDQGGQVRLNWNKSPYDNSLSSPQVSSYSIFRKSSSGAYMVVKAMPIPKNILMDSSLLGYDYVENVPAFQLPNYQIVVPTLEDSTASGTHYFRYIVVAQTSDLNQYYVSAIDSGYSVDNLAPIPPAGLLASVLSGPQVKLIWNSPSDPDVGSYSIYRSTTSEFTPAAGNKIGTSFSTVFTDSNPLSGDLAYYRIIAVDVHGNGSLPSPQVTATLSITQQVGVQDKWNMISVSLAVNDFTKTALYPAATSNAFAYNGASYVITSTLTTGTGYWLKFSGAQSPTLTGLLLTNDTISVTTGWNMIGSLSQPIAVSSISSVPGGITTSRFFGYQGSYVITDSIRHGKGYWIKVNQDGKLVMSSSAQATPSTAIRIVPTEELPPSSPEANDVNLRTIPTSFALEQNYPNPFNPTTIINYALPEQAFVRLTIYNTLGQQVATLVNEMQDAGNKIVEFDANNFPSGMYFYKITAGTFNDIKKMILLK